VLLMTRPELSMDVQTAARAIIEVAILDHPRSAQPEIGASEIGTPCLRKLGHKLAGTPRARPVEAAWRPTVGTAVHTWLESAFTKENERLGWDRWVLERKVTVGYYGGHVDLTGHCDVYDRLTRTVVDWKVPGPTTMKKVRAAKHPGETYKVQAHCYGKGWRNEGEDVETVAVYFLPSAGELGDAYYWSEPYDESTALAALARARSLHDAADTIGWSALLATLPRTEDYCTGCPWWRPGSADPSVSCPGALPERATKFDPTAAFGRVGNK
jgi:hypothetical protein